MLTARQRATVQRRRDLLTLCRGDWVTAEFLRGKLRDAHAHSSRRQAHRFVVQGLLEEKRAAMPAKFRDSHRNATWHFRLTDAGEAHLASTAGDG